MLNIIIIFGIAVHTQKLKQLQYTVLLTVLVVDVIQYTVPVICTVLYPMFSIYCYCTIYCILHMYTMIGLHYESLSIVTGDQEQLYCENMTPFYQLLLLY